MNNTVLPPPLPSVIGGNNQRPSPVEGGGSFHYDSQDRETPELQGNYLIEDKGRYTGNFEFEFHCVNIISTCLSRLL